jgi:uncharacterized membrane protein
MNPKMTGKQFTMKVLNGISLGVVVALIPSALVGQLMKALLPIFPAAAEIITMTTFAMSLLPAIMGFCVGMQFKLNSLQNSSIALATMIGSGVMQAQNSKFVLQGTGDIINSGVTIVFAVALAIWIKQHLKNYTILLLPLLVITVAGGIGLLTLPKIKLIATAIGGFIAYLTKIQPLLMGTLMGISFALLIVSPISSVGIATAINLAGVGSGSANLGITAAGFMLAIYGSSVNPLGTTLAHFIGSPKIQMGNLLEKPGLYFPLALNAAILGFLGAVFEIKGTPMSAGFGFSGLIGPLAAWSYLPTNWLNGFLVVLLFLILPVVLAVLSRYLFIKRLGWFKPQNLQLKVN